MRSRPARSTRSVEPAAVAEARGFFGGDTLCFVEIKARRTAGFGPAIGAVGPRKQQRIAKAAAAYLIRSEWSGPCRFDVLGMDRGEQGWDMTLIRGAFEIS